MTSSKESAALPVGTMATIRAPICTIYSPEHTVLATMQRYLFANITIGVSGTYDSRLSKKPIRYWDRLSHWSLSAFTSALDLTKNYWRKLKG